jgi:hypothetical protein
MVTGLKVRKFPRWANLYGSDFEEFEYMSHNLISFFEIHFNITFPSVSKSCRVVSCVFIFSLSQSIAFMHDTSLVISYLSSNSNVVTYNSEL